MKYKKRILIICFILSLFTIASVAAGEINETFEINQKEAEILVDGENQLTVEQNATGSFYDLSSLIENTSEGNTLELNEDYEFDFASYDGISINKSITIDGKGHNIDGLSQSRIFNISNSKIILKNINFINTYSDECGGAIFLKNSDAEIINCTFNLNHAENGGAVYTVNSNLNISDCIFTNNKCTGLYVEGGALSSSQSNITVLNSIFHNNTADTGGAMAFIFSDAIIANCTFNDNTANWYGGALFSDYFLDITSSRFNNNRAGCKGGAIHSSSSPYENSCLIMNSSDFFNNSAIWGGAISTSNSLFNYIYNSHFDNNYAVYGAVFARLETTPLIISNSSCSNNNATNGTVIYAPSRGNIILNNSNFTDNYGEYGCLIYTIQGRFGMTISINKILCNNCFITDNYATNSLIYSVFGNIAVNNSSLTYNNSQYPFYVIYKISSGDVSYENNWWGSSQPDFNKLIYINDTIEDSNSNDTSVDSDDDCASVVIQIDENNTVFSYRRDSGTQITIHIGGTGEVRQEKYDWTYFIHVIITEDGWVYGNGGIDMPYTDERMEAISKNMIKNNEISTESLEAILNLKISDSWGHYIIKAPDGRYGLVDYFKTGDGENVTALETGVLKTGEYILSPNDYRLYKKGNVSDLNMSDYVTASRYIAATDTYGSKRTTIQTYEYKKEIVNNQIVTSVDVYLSNDDGHLVNRSGHEQYLNDIYINGEYIFGEDIPIVMGGMYVTELTLSTVNLTNIKIIADNLTMNYKGSERFLVKLTDLNGKSINNANITIIINGQKYIKTTDSNGFASMAINLASGVYNVTVEYNEVKAYSTITVNPTILAKDVTKMFKNETQYHGTFIDSEGNLLKNTDVKFNINGVFYTRTTDSNGVAKLNINLAPGTYILTAENPSNGELQSSTIKVLPSIVENYDLTKYFKNASQYSIRLLDSQGNPVGAGVSVVFNINGVFYTRYSDASGYVKMNINLAPGQYIITADYNGLMASNTINVLPILEGEDISMKFHDGTKYEVKLLDGQGNPFASQIVTFNINGVFYQRMTDENGIASLNINLQEGEYIITSEYNGMMISNIIKITST